MNFYERPTIEIALIENTDIIATSFGTETSLVENEEGNWEI